MIFDFSNPDLYNHCYLPLFHNRSRFLHLYGSAGSGKSVFAVQKEVVLTFDERRRNRKTLVVRKVYGTLKNSVHAQIKAQIYEWNLQDLFSVTLSPLSITNKLTNVSFIFIGLDDVEKVKSIQGVDRIYIEEATELSRGEELDQLSLRLRGFNEVQITLAYNPVNAHHWINAEIHQNRLPGHFIFKSTYKDNRFLDSAYIEYMDSLAISNPAYYKVYGKGEWGQNVEGLIYPDYDSVSLMPRIQGYGLDFGFNDPCALTAVSILDEPGQFQKSLYLEEKLYKIRLTSNDLIAEMEKLQISKRLPIICDNARPEMISDLKKAGFNAKPCRKGKDSVKAGINEVKKYRIKIVAGSKNIFKEIDNYDWLEKNGIWLDEPNPNAIEHSLDGVRYYVNHFSRSGSGVAGF